MAGRVLKRIARENVNVSLTLPASLPFNREFAPRSATQSVEKSDSVTPPINTLSGRSRGKLTVDGQTGGQSEAHIDILPCNSFQHSARHTLFIRRCSDLIRGGCAPLFQSSRLDVNRMAVRVSALHAKRFTSVTGLHSISAGTCPLPLNVSLQKSDSVTPPLGVENTALGAL